MLFRIVSQSGKSKPALNLVFLLTAGGKVNFAGSKRWLEEQREEDAGDLLSNVKMVVCLDSLGLGDALRVHVSKPPKEGTMAHSFIGNLKQVGLKISKLNHIRGRNVCDERIASAGVGENHARLCGSGHGSQED